MRQVVVLAICGALLACNSRPQEHGGNKPATELASSDTQPSGSVVAMPAHVTRADFEIRGLKWPLTVNEAELGCSQLSRWVLVNNKRYGLNGTAGGQGYADLDPIWKNDEAMEKALKAAGATNEPPTKVSVSDMSEAAARFCY